MAESVSTDARMEALLFAAGEPLSFAQLRSLLQTDTLGLTKAIDTLRARLIGGIQIVVTDTHVALTTAPFCDEDVRSFLTPTADEREVGQAGLEVLSIVLYQGPSTKATIDYIRGVNSSSTLRTLVYRGLLERMTKGREVVYHASPDLLAHLGIGSPSEMPELEAVREELSTFLKRSEETPPEESPTHT